MEEVFKSISLVPEVTTRKPAVIKRSQASEAAKMSKWFVKHAALHAPKQVVGPADSKKAAHQLPLELINHHEGVRLIASGTSEKRVLAILRPRRGVVGRRFLVLIWVSGLTDVLSGW